MEKKSNKGLVCLVVVLIVALLGAVGYILYDKGIIIKKSDKVYETDKTSVTKSKKDSSISNDEAMLILDLWGITTDNVQSYNEKEEVKFNVAASHLVDVTAYFKSNIQERKYYSEFNCAELKDDSDWYYEQNNDGYMRTKNGVANYCSGYGHNIIPYDMLSNNYKYMFGSDKTIEKKDYGSYVYLSKYDGYVNLPYHDGTGGGEVFLKEIKKVESKNDKLLIYVYMDEFGLVDGNSNKVKVGDKQIDVTDTIEKDIIEKYSDEVNVYKITFNIENNHYVFNKIEKQ